MRISGIKLFSIKQYRLQMGLLMFVADAAAFASVWGLLGFLASTFPVWFGRFEGQEYLVLVLLCFILFLYSRLYPGGGVNPAEEIRLVVERASIGIFLGIVIFLFIRPAWRPNLWTLILIAAAVPSAVLILRWGIRIWASRRQFWGEPVVVIADRGRIESLVQYFLQRRRLGFVPVLAVVPDLGADALTLPVPAIRLTDLLEAGGGKMVGEEVQTALVEMERAEEIIRLDTQNAFPRLFRQVVLFMDVDWLEGASLRVQDFEGLLGVEARRNVLSPSSKALKRAMDLAIGLLAGIVFLPVIGLAALLIRLDGPGPVFFFQERIGRKGERIRVCKFRTMIPDADRALEAYLRENRAAREEWSRTQKLKDDPRVTRVGKWLRKLSIDELPQLINVFKGEMSLVGPRPMMVGQEALHPGLDSYYEVRPGLTGLWQVSGRNRTTFEERARYDVYYVRNWSMWLDVYILLRTLWVVASQDGAY